MKKDHLISAALILAGGILSALCVQPMKSDGQFQDKGNPFAIQRSAYGKLFARLSETTIDRVWHLGVEQIVPHYMSGIEHDEHDEHCEHCEQGECAEHGKSGGSPHLSELPPITRQVIERSAEDIAAVTAANRKTPLEKGKRWIQDRVIAQHTRTNPNAMSKQHLATVYHDIEELLLRSFKMDPTHYGAYDSYHLFLTTYDFGGDPHVKEQAVLIANVAISSAQGETEDPEPWLTAATAGMNLYLLDSTPFVEAGKPIPLELLERYRDLIGTCISHFEQIQAQAEENGNWGRLSTDRQMEIAQRAYFANRTFAQFEPMIARATKSPGTPAPGAPTPGAPTPEEKVAKTDPEPLGSKPEN